MVHFRELSDEKINFLKDILDGNENLKTWKNILEQYKINKQSDFKWLQPIHAIPNPWKKEMEHGNGNCKDLLLLNDHLIKNSYWKT